MIDVVLVWLPPVQPNGDVSYSYTIEVTETSILITSGVTTDLNVTITDLNPFTNYTFTVTAVTLGGLSTAVSLTFVTFPGSELKLSYCCNEITFFLCM